MQHRDPCTIFLRRCEANQRKNLLQIRQDSNWLKDIGNKTKNVSSAAKLCKLYLLDLQKTKHATAIAIKNQGFWNWALATRWGLRSGSLGTTKRDLHCVALPWYCTTQVSLYCILDIRQLNWEGATADERLRSTGEHHLTNCNFETIHLTEHNKTSWIIHNEWMLLPLLKCSVWFLSWKTCCFNWKKF